MPDQFDRRVRAEVRLPQNEFGYRQLGFQSSYKPYAISSLQ
jgi:hypothetical protein